MRAIFTRVLLDVDGGPVLLLLRLLLLPLTLLMHAGASIRNALYDSGLLPVEHVGAPVISVGNLTVGGTGKTPLIIELARRARARGRRVAVVARGYGAVADEHGRTDEVAMLAERCPDVEIVVGPSKLRGAREAAQAGADLILVDDGMQHRRLFRDCEIVVVDARAPFGTGMVVPGGSLREPAAGISRADVIVLTHGESISEPEREAVELSVRAYKRTVAVVWAHHEATALRPVSGGPSQPPDALAGLDVELFCGVASPEGFRETVERLGAHVTGLHAFPDHHAFRPEDLAAIRSRARASQLVCTEKDAAKVARIPGNEDVLALLIDLELESELPPLPGLDLPWAPSAAEDDAHAASHAAHHAAT
ncbi:MAG: tetraacyldisaccharide 4'-kinase [Planctomycetota bacterium]|jgi:tetraacyldisaccharide 4'-kinase